jgi:hypothetical protein
MTSTEPTGPEDHSSESAPRMGLLRRLRSIRNDTGAGRGAREEAAAEAAGELERVIGAGPPPELADRPLATAESNAVGVHRRFRFQLEQEQTTAPGPSDQD